MKKVLEFQTSIGEIKQINSLFSMCKVRIMYSGRNNNLSIMEKAVVEKALPSIIGVPIVGEYSEENKDFKGHGGKIDLDSYKYIHTTKPYGFVPESANYEWEEVTAKDGSKREYLSISGCYLWTGRYPEALEVIQYGKGQSMEIEVTKGEWDDNEDAYRINDFIFSALCILGDDFSPAFEDAAITAYTLNKESFKQEFSKMIEELKASLTKKEGVDTMEELLKKYGLTKEDLTAKGIEFEGLSEEELEAKILEIASNEDNDEEDQGNPEGQNQDQNDNEGDGEGDDENGDKDENPENQDQSNPEGQNQDQNDGGDQSEEVVSKEEFEQLKEDYSAMQVEFEDLKKKYKDELDELETLRQFKLDTEKEDHQTKVAELFAGYELSEADVEEIDIHKFTLEEIESKCFEIIGRKFAKKKNFSKEEKKSGIKLNLDKKDEKKTNSPYGNLFDKLK